MNEKRKKRKKRKEKKERKKEMKMKEKKKEYNRVTLLVELSQVTPVSKGCVHKSFIPVQFKCTLKSNELYQSIKIF